jgi:hypothetical protein
LRDNAKGIGRLKTMMAMPKFSEASRSLTVHAL